MLSLSLLHPLPVLPLSLSLLHPVLPAHRACRLSRRSNLPGRDLQEAAVLRLKLLRLHQGRCAAPREDSAQAFWQRRRRPLLRHPGRPHVPVQAPAPAPAPALEASSPTRRRRKSARAPSPLLLPLQLQLARQRIASALGAKPQLLPQLAQPCATGRWQVQAALSVSAQVQAVLTHSALALLLEAHCQQRSPSSIQSCSVSILMSRAVEWLVSTVTAPAAATMQLEAAHRCSPLQLMMRSLQLRMLRLGTAAQPPLPS